MTEHLIEDALLVFFTDKTNTISASTHWAHYSMLKTMLNLKNNIYVTKFYKTALLKRKSEGYKPKKVKTLIGEQVDEF